MHQNFDEQPACLLSAALRVRWHPRQPYRPLECGKRSEGQVLPSALEELLQLPAADMGLDAISLAVL